MGIGGKCLEEGDWMTQEGTGSLVAYCPSGVTILSAGGGEVTQKWNVNSWGGLLTGESCRTGQWSWCRSGDGSPGFHPIQLVKGGERREGGSTGLIGKKVRSERKDGPLSRGDARPGLLGRRE